jgi:hypothetical protein
LQVAAAGAAMGASGKGKRDGLLPQCSHKLKSASAPAKHTSLIFKPFFGSLLTRSVHAQRVQRLGVCRFHLQRVKSRGPDSKVLKSKPQDLLQPNGIHISVHFFGGGAATLYSTISFSGFSRLCGAPPTSTSPRVAFPSLWRSKPLPLLNVFDTGHAISKWFACLQPLHCRCANFHQWYSFRAESPLIAHSARICPPASSAVP